MNKRYFSKMPTLDDAQIKRAMREGVDLTDATAVQAFARRIRTTDTMLTAEPASRTPDMGTLWTGGDPHRSPGADVESIFGSFARACDQLHPDDVAKIRDLMRKYGADFGTTNGMGITTTDHIPSRDGRVLRGMRDQSDSAVRDINAANRKLWGGANRTTDTRRREPASPESINEANRAFWDGAA